MGAGDGALRPCAVRFDVHQRVGLSLRELFCFKPFTWLLVRATKESRPLPGKRGNMEQDQWWFLGTCVEHSRGTAREIAQEESRRGRNGEVLTHKIVLP